jgi:hypothetical protein
MVVIEYEGRAWQLVIDCASSLVHLLCNNIHPALLHQLCRHYHYYAHLSNMRLHEDRKVYIATI